MSIIPSIVSVGCVGLRGLSTATECYLELNNMLSDEDFDILKAATLVSRAAISILDICFQGGQIVDISKPILEKLKFSEITIRCIHIPLHIGAYQEEHKIVDFLKFSAVQIASLFRSVFETANLEEKLYLDLAKKDPESQRPIYGFKADGSSLDSQISIIGYKKIDPLECEKNLNAIANAIIFLNVVETGATLGMVETAYRIYINKVLSRAWRAEGVNVTQENGEESYQSNANMASNQILRSPVITEIHDLLDLKKCTLIPKEFENDKVLKKQYCPISHSAIRHVVQDPTAKGENPVFYEKEAIETWLQKNQRSPLTKLPLKKEDLLIRPDVQEKIDQRLDYFSKGMVSYVKEKFCKDAVDKEDD